MQLVAYGAQDVYLTGNSQVTFFKQLYKRYTNFAMQSVEAGFNGSIGFGKRVALVVPRVGDLMGRVYLQATLPAWEGTSNTDSWIDGVGHFLINNVEVQIGGQIIDKHYGTWLHIWYQLALPQGKKEGYADMVNGNGAAMSQAEKEIYVPLQFWFCRHEGLINSPSDSQNLLLVIYAKYIATRLDVRETPKVLTTTSIGKPVEGPQVITVLA